MFILNTKAHKRDTRLIISSKVSVVTKTNQSIVAPSTQFNDVKPNYLQSDLNSVS